MAMNILICGFGVFGRKHAEAWKKAAGDCKLLVADINSEMRKAAVEAGCNAEDVGDFNDLISRADIVDIVTTSESHFDLAKASLSAGKPTLIEKPAVKSIEEAKFLKYTSEEIGVPVQIQFVLRAHPLVLLAQEVISAGTIGRLVAMDGVFTGWKRMRPDASMCQRKAYLEEVCQKRCT
jgi:predicted dehydrogenase